MQAKLRQIIDQLESCDYECIAGPLENNVAFQELKKLPETEDQKDSIIIEFITKFQGLAYQNLFQVCFLCGGGRVCNQETPELWKPEHAPDCLFSRAEKLVINERQGT